MVHCAQSVWPLHFLSETKITFLGIIFVQILQNIASIRNRDELSVFFLNYTGFSSKQRRVRVLWGFIINCKLTYFEIVYIYQLNFSFYETRYHKKYSLDTLSHLHICFKNINFSKWTLTFWRRNYFFKILAHPVPKM